MMALKINPQIYKTMQDIFYDMGTSYMNLSDYEIISNQEAGYGRVDIILLHKTDKNRLAIIIELKTIDEFEEETKEKALENAVKQIKEKEYIALVQKRGYENILSFGVVFDGKRVWVKQV